MSKTFWELNIIRACTVFLASTIYFCLFCIKGEYVIYYRVLLLELFAVVLDISWFFQGIEDFKKVVIRNSIIKLASLVCILLFIKTKDDLLKYFVIYVFSTFFGNISFWIKINKCIDKISFEKLTLKKHIKPMVSLFIPQIASSIYTVLDKTMLGAIGKDISEVGYYEQSQKIIKVALTFVTALSMVMIPRISNGFAKGEKKQIKDYMKESFTFDWFLSCPIVFGIIAISEKFVPWFYGEGYEKIIYLLIYISPVVLFISLSTTIGLQYLTSIKKQNIQTIAVMLGALSNLLLNFALIPQYKSFGAALSTVIAEFIITIIEILYITTEKDITINDIFGSLYKYLISSIAMCIVVKIISNYMSVSIINTFIQITIGGIIYIGILLIEKDDFLMRNINKIIKRKDKQCQHT